MALARSDGLRQKPSRTKAPTVRYQSTSTVPYRTPTSRTHAHLPLLTVLVNLLRGIQAFETIEGTQFSQRPRRAFLSSVILGHPRAASIAASCPNDAELYSKSSGEPHDLQGLEDPRIESVLIRDPSMATLVGCCTLSDCSRCNLPIPCYPG